MAYKDYFSAAAPATLEQILDSRERRAGIQRRLLELYGKPLLCYTLNIPGEYKLYPLAKRTFKEGACAIERELQGRRVPVLHHQSSLAVTGCEGYYCVDMDAEAVKSLAMLIENHHPLGRLFDIDVLGTDKNIVKGSALGRGERECLICGGPVWKCSRSRTHPAEQLAIRTAQIMDEFFARRFADKVCETAVRALLYEVSITPKPGLVDRTNTGAHSDMDIFTFMDSSCSLISYFRDITLRAMDFDGGADRLLPELRYLGRCAEEDMFASTSGVNTHKGLIFSMGIVCAALGHLYKHGLSASSDSLLGLCSEIAGSSPNELEAGAKGQATYGQKAYDRYRIKGARGEAAAGFPSVRDIGLPVLMKYIHRGCPLNDAGVITLLHLIAGVDDTNMVNRSSLGKLREIQAEVLDLTVRTDDPAELIEAAKALDERFIQENLSPGGSADLLALSLMVYWVAKPGFWT